MSAANVTFETLNYAPATIGNEERFSFTCPKRQRSACSGLLIRGKGNDVPKKTWEWDGNRELPTFIPSINCDGCWHGYIRDGRCVDAHGVDEPEPGV